MRRLAPQLFLVLVLAFPALANAQAAIASSAWIQAEETGEQGQGTFVRTARGCLLITAAHVLGKDNKHLASYVRWKTEGASGRAHIVDRAYKPNTHLDFAVLEPIEGKPPVCPDAPTQDIVAAKIGRSAGEIARVSSTGERIRIPTRVSEDRPFLVVAPSPASGASDAQEGISGAAYRVDDVIVGVVVGVDNRDGKTEIEIQTLADLPPLTMAALALAGAAPAATKYDESQLPEIVRATVRASRAVKARAEANAASALAIARLADEAAAEARRPDHAPDLAVFRDDVWEYAGYATYDPTTRKATPNGLGVMTYIKGPETGRQYECRFSLKTASACEGLGRIKGPKGKTKHGYEWLGGICMPAPYCGEGVLVSEYDVVFYMKVGADGPGVLDVPCGQGCFERFEITFQGQGSYGPGVIWDNEGKVKEIGRYENGKLIEDFRLPKGATSDKTPP